uniref:lysine--tRNA ligase n=1 Tax=Chenopodium quinoa TaxID=63459 RepID=A0A803LWX3_CHEQI
MAINEAKNYYKNRLAFLAEQKSSGINPYPHEFPAGRISILEFKDRYDKELNHDDRLDVEVSLAGRIMTKRTISSKLIFYDLHDVGGETQIMANASISNLEETEFMNFHQSVKRGDIAGVTGFPGKSKKGLMCIIPTRFVVLSPCLHVFPLAKKMESWAPGKPRHPDQYTLNDQETRYGKRFLDMIVNVDVRKIFEIRARVISFIKRFLDKKGFLEVETPVMNANHSIGAARPFVVTNNNLKTLFMRISLELHLKQLLVRGYERVFEIGKQFRCENIDMTHHLKFTTCEFYMSYADYNTLITMNDDMLSECLDKDKKPMKIDFTPPFRVMKKVIACCRAFLWDGCAASSGSLAWDFKG